MKSNIRILKLTPNFIEKNIKVFEGIISDNFKEYWKRKEFLMELEGKWDYSIALMLQEQIIGFIIASIKFDKVHIHKFAIHQNYRGQKYGKLLLREFENIVIMKFAAITLKVYEENIPAIHFYYRENFIKISQNNQLLLLEKRLL